MTMKYISFFLFVCLCAAVALFSGERGQERSKLLGAWIEGESAVEAYESGSRRTKAETVVVVDPGHGGNDPGKVGTGGVEEKGINLSIAGRLKSLLELNDITVVMTRETDEGLYDSSASNKKADDLKKRVKLIEESGASVAVSIHQNSYTDASCRGAQTFYYTDSSEGEELARILLEQLKAVLNDGNHRTEKENDSYYMLKKSTIPTVIVECGFLSNPDEKEMLLSEEYQEKIAWALHLGILEYLNTIQQPAM